MATKRTKTKAAIVPEVLAPVDTALAQQVAFVIECHDEVERMAAGLARRAIMCGAALIHIKSETRHGEWVPFFAENLAREGFGIRHAQNYMRAAKRAIESLPARSAKLLTAGDGSNTEAVDKALAKVTKATTLGELFADLFEKPKAPKSGGANQLNGWLRDNHPDHVGTAVADLPPEVRVAWQEHLDGQRLSDDERIELEREQAAHTWQRLAVDLDEWGTRGKTFGMLPPPHREALVGLFEGLAADVRKTLAPPPKPTTKQKGRN